MVELARTFGAVVLHPDAALALDKRVDELRALGVEVFVVDELEKPDSLRHRVSAPWMLTGGPPASARPVTRCTAWQTSECD